MNRWKAFLAACIAMALASTAVAVPRIITFQGQLSDTNGVPITTEVDVTFTFHDDVSGGSQLTSFSDTRTVTPDANGIYSTFIGSDAMPIPTTVFDGDEVWLNINLEGDDLAPRLRITSTGYAIRAASADTLQGHDASDFLAMRGNAYVIVKTTDSALQNGVNLLAAYEVAKGLTPNGGALAADNRAVLLVAPGSYDLGAQSLTLDAEYVDLVGLSTARENQHIFSSENVVVQTARDVRIENLVPHYTGGNNETHAYYPDATWNDGANTGSAPETRIRNTTFKVDAENLRSMRTGVEYAGHYEDCVGEGVGTFGGLGEASGTFIRCTGGDSSFAVVGEASGTFTHCTGGNNSFGAVPFGVGSGTFINCTGGNNSFGFRDSSGARFYYCVGGPGSFRKDGTPAPLHFFCVQDDAQYAGND